MLKLAFYFTAVGYFAAISTVSKSNENLSICLVEVEGYGPYKPVPPPKPLPQQALQSQELQQLDCFTPPPYRMPPYPLFNEPNIPGAAGLDHPIASSSPATPQGLHTHSSKFPVSKQG